MLRFLAPLALATTLLTVPTALADVSVAVGPDGIVDPEGEPYYVWATLAEPKPPGHAEPSDDCAYGGPRPGPTTNARELAQALAQWDPTNDFGAGSWAPTCVGASTPGCTMDPCLPSVWFVHAYASYNLTTGTYYVEVATPLLASGAPADGIAISGRSGASLSFDCVGCPPPVCCDE